MHEGLSTEVVKMGPGVYGAPGGPPPGGYGRPPGGGYGAPPPGGGHAYGARPGAPPGGYGYGPPGAMGGLDCLAWVGVVLRYATNR